MKNKKNKNQKNQKKPEKKNISNIDYIETDYSQITSKVKENILGLYETDILEIKNLKKTNKSVHNEIVKNKLNCIRFKIMFFFIITYILLFFFWIYLGCFCAVYKNTQIHLLIDVSSSFALSFITPLFINLLPGFFRIPSLKNSKSKKGNNRALYKFSKVLQFL